MMGTRVLCAIIDAAILSDPGPFLDYQLKVSDQSRRSSGWWGGAVRFQGTANIQENHNFGAETSVQSMMKDESHSIISLPTDGKDFGLSSKVDTKYLKASFTLSSIDITQDWSSQKQIN